jgi:hypothetical protein
MTDEGRLEAELLDDWNGRAVPVARSRGSGVIALADYADNVMRDPAEPWPPPAVTQKLVYSLSGGTSFEAKARELLTRKLGYYSTLQSMHSEDAITWSFFGLLITASGASRTAVLNWLMERADLPYSENSVCSVDVWRRIPHPDTGAGQGGPELDAMLVGDQCVVLVEAKWRSREGVAQGRARDKTQMQLRREFLEKHGRAVFGGRDGVVLGVSWKEPVEAMSPSGSAQAATRELRWEDLAQCVGHPQGEEFARHYEWRASNSNA